MTLVEIMVSVVLFSLGGLCLLMSLSQAYKLAALARYQNQAQYVLRSLADQFLIAGSQHPIISAPFSTQTGIGLAWDGDQQIYCYPTDSIALDGTGDAIGTASGLVVPLGNIRINGVNTAIAPLNATFTRKVTVNSSGTAAGTIYQGDFTAKFTFMNNAYTLTTTAVRTLP